MPCRCDYMEEPKVVYKGTKEALAERDEAKAQLKEEYRKRYSERVELNTALKNLRAKYNNCVKDFDDMTWAFCFVTNKLFDHDPLFLEILLQADERFKRIFDAHQVSDMSAGRSFLYVDKNGVRKRFIGKE